MAQAEALFLRSLGEGAEPPGRQVVRHERRTTQGPAADVVQALPVPPTPEAIEQSEEAITQPAKLLRIASMVRELLEQTRQTTLDEPGRKRLRRASTAAWRSELSEGCSPPISAEELGALGAADGSGAQPRPNSGSRRRSSSAGSRVCSG